MAGNAHSFSGDAAQVDGQLRLCSGPGSSGEYTILADIAPNFSVRWDAKVPAWSLSALAFHVINDVQRFSFRWPEEDQMQMCDGLGVPLRSWALTAPLLSGAWNSFALTSIDDLLVLSVNGVGYEGAVPNWGAVKNDWKNGAFAFSAANSSAVAAPTLVRQVHVQSTLTFDDPVRCKASLLAKAINAERLGAADVRCGRLTVLGEVTAANLGALSALDSVDYGMLTGTPPWRVGGGATYNVTCPMLVDGQLGCTSHFTGTSADFSSYVTAGGGLVTLGPTGLIRGTGLRVRSPSGATVGTVYVNDSGLAGTTGVLQFVNGSHFIACGDAPSYGGVDSGGVPGSGHRMFYSSGSHTFAGPLRARNGLVVPGAGAELHLGEGAPGREANAGRLAYCPSWANDALAVVGAGASVGSRRVRLWDDVTVAKDLGVLGHASVANGLTVSGGLTVNGSPFRNVYAGSHVVEGGVDGVNSYTVTHNWGLAGTQTINVQVQDTEASPVPDCFATKVVSIGPNSFVVQVYRLDSKGGWWNRHFKLVYTIHT